MSGQVLFHLEYALSKMDYTRFNGILYQDALMKMKRSQIITGIVALLIAGGVIATFMITVEFQYIFLALAFFLVIYGVYSIAFYPLSLPRQLKKRAKREYMTAVSTNTYHLEVSAEGIYERVTGLGTSAAYYPWNCFRKIYIFDSHVVLLEQSGAQGIVIPSHSLDKNSDTALKAFLVAVGKENEIQLIYEK